jgi:hypothetical protein
MNMMPTIPQARAGFTIEKMSNNVRKRVIIVCVLLSGRYVEVTAEDIWIFSAKCVLSLRGDQEKDPDETLTINAGIT